jgi:hypothetical protein
MVNLDRYSLSYQRRLEARNGKLTFSAAGEGFRVSGLPERNVLVYRLDGAAVTRLLRVQVSADETGYSVVFAGPRSGAGTYTVVSESALLKPALEAARVRADLEKRADYLMIAHPNFMAGVQRLADARRAEGLSVSVVDVTDLYTAYTGGVFDPAAIQAYIRHAAQNLGVKYVLLVGGDTYDYRNYLGRNSVSYIPSLYAATGPYAKSVPVDPLYTDLNGDRLPDLAIGRLPVRTEAELAILIDKTLAYGQKDYRRTALFASDRVDPAVSFKVISTGLALRMPGNWTVENVHLDDLAVATARQRLQAAMNRGTALVTFTGHSGPTNWTYNNLFSMTDAANLTNAGRPFVTVQWGCWNNYYVDPLNNTLVHGLLLSGDRGAAASLGAVTLTDAYSERQLGELLTPRLTQPGMRLGDALQAAKAELAASQPGLLDVLLGWTLMGDPTLVIEP